MIDQVQDRQQRLQALDPARSFIVQAPAGSGKTELLIQRFLTLLGQVEQPEAVVAVTFTRKAAAEMRHRVISALRSASEPQPQTPHEARTWKLAQAALARNDKLNWSLTEQPSRLRIQTIDSLCALLVRQMPWVSRMGASLGPEEDAGRLYRQAARQTLAMLDSEQARADVSADLSRLLAHLDNNVATTEQLVSTMLGKRDQWLRHLVGTPPSDDLREDLESALRRVVERALERAASTFPHDGREATVGLARFAAGNLREQHLESPIASCFALSDFPDDSLESLPHWLGLAEMFLTRQGTRRRTVNKNHGFPPTPLGRGAKEVWRGIELDDDSEAALHQLRSLPPLRFDDGKWEVLAALMRLLPVASGQLQLVFRDEGSVDFTEIAIRARDALGTDLVPTNLAFALDCRIQHLLVDEFQDTSQSQYDLLARLIGDWQPGDGRTLFLVGDPMQSIYGFREAEVGLFLSARANGIAAVRPEPLTLSVNFRSGPGIVDWVNRAMSEAFPETENVLTGAVTYEPSVPFEGGGPDRAVCLHPFLINDPESEARRVIEIIEEAQSKNPCGTTAVLVLARSHLFHIVAALRRRGKKFRAVEIDALGERPVVQDLMSLTRALLQPGDRLAWLSILRAPWCGLRLADLDALVNGDSTTALWDLIRDPARRKALSPDGRTRIDRLIPLLGNALVRRGRLPVRRRVESLWIALGGPACLETRAELEDAAATLDLLERSTDGMQLLDETGFAEEVARLYAPSDVEAGEELQLMTIHKAKGLEFDTVILPGLGRLTRHDDPRLLRWMEYPDADRSRLLLAPIPQAAGEKDPLYDYLKGIDWRKRVHENTRLLYVAATRARKGLHLLGHTRLDLEGAGLKTPDSRSLLAKIWTTVEPEFSDCLEDRVAEEEDNLDAVTPEPPGIPLRRLTADWTPPAPPEDVVWEPRKQLPGAEDPGPRQPTFEWAGELQRRVGTVVHRMLQQLRAPDRLNFSRDTLLAALRQEGLDGRKLDEALARAVSALTNLTGDDRGRWILSLHQEDQREYALSTVVHGRVRHYVLDRTFVASGTRWIIDYKTGPHTGGSTQVFLDNEQERYRVQLESYARVIRSMDSRPIRLGLYFPMLQGWREWVSSE
ncbi:MAG: UvrD-helicase domain-containing protein [Acidobacteria bacterium]|nr:UvrD-helicase domain-containing protein [Acidobacteriota bacterium]